MSCRFQPTTIQALSVWKDQAYRDGAHLFEGKRPVSWWYVVDQSNTVVGCIGLLRAGAHRAYVRGWYILPGYRGRGYGKQAMEFAVAEARRLGVRILETKTAHREEMRRWGWTSTGRLYSSFRPKAPGEQFILRLQP